MCCSKLHSCSKATERGPMERTPHIFFKLLTLPAIVLVVKTFMNLQQFGFVDVGQ